MNSLATTLGFSLCFGIAGCASPWPAREPLVGKSAPSALVLRVQADWDDVEASLLTAASQSECALLSLEYTDNVWVGTIVSVHDDRAALRVQGDESVVPSEIVLTIEPSAASDRGVLTRFGERAQRRLRQLRGVRTAPLDGPER